MITVLLQQIIDMLKDFFQHFIDWSNVIGDKIAGIKDDTADISNSNNAIKSNTDDIKDNTGAIITPVNSIKTNSDSIKTDTTTIKNTVGTMSNQLSTISSNVGATSAFSEDIATNTLNILDKITTIASDTTQMRSDNQVIISNTNDIESYIKLLGKGLKKTSYAEGYITSFNTDLKEGLTEFKLPIPISTVGISSVEITNCKKNLLDPSIYIQKGPPTVGDDETHGIPNTRYARFKRIPSDRALKVSFTNFDPDRNHLNGIWISRFRISDTVNIEDIGAKAIPYASIDTMEVPAVPGTYILVFVWSRSGYELTYPFTGWVQVEDSEEITDYEPFDGEHHKIEFGETITAGATLDVNKGILTRADGTTKQIDPLIVPSAIGRNEIYNDLASYNELGYNESIYNVINKELGG